MSAKAKVIIKAISSNRTWVGRRIKSTEYQKYEKELMWLLPALHIPPAPYQINFNFGFSNKLIDIDNSIKPTMDILQKRYGFNDRYVFRLIVEKEFVPKGSEYIEFEILSYVKSSL